MSTSVFTTAPCDICAKGLRIGNRYFVVSQPERPGITDCCSIQCVETHAKEREYFIKTNAEQTGLPLVHFHGPCEQCGKSDWRGINYEVIIRGPANDLEALYLCSPTCVVDWVADNNNDDSLYEDDWEEEDEFEDDDEELDDDEDEDKDDDDDEEL